MILKIFFVVILLWYLFPVVQVIGDSMSPTYEDGTFLLSLRIPFFLKRLLLIPNCVYVIRPPVTEGENEERAIKRLHHVKNCQSYFLGDNSSISYDSRYYGYIHPKRVDCIILFVLKKGGI